MSESPLRAVPEGIAGAEDGSPAFQLDRDPFLESGLPDPLERRLDELERRRPPRLRAVTGTPDASAPPARPRPLRAPIPPRPRSTAVPSSCARSTRSASVTTTRACA